MYPLTLTTRKGTYKEGEYVALFWQFLEKWVEKRKSEIASSTQDTYNDVKERFIEAGIEPPEAIKKPAEDSPELQKRSELQEWLAKFCQPSETNQALYDFLTLRRGILNVVNELENDIDNITDDFQDLDKGTFLKGIKWLLRDFHVPEDKYSDVYFALCDYLSKPYERFGKENLNKDKERHFKLPLVRLRNWISHGLIIGSNTRFSAKEAGLIFLMVMKSMFNQEKYGQPDELKRLYSSESVVHKQMLYELVGMYQSQYRDREANPLDVIYRRTQKEINTKELDGERYMYWKDENYIMHFYAAYLFSATKPVNPRYRDKETKEIKEASYPRNVYPDKLNPLAIQICYYHELQDTPFSSIVLQQLRPQLECERACWDFENKPSPNTKEELKKAAKRARKQEKADALIAYVNARQYFERNPNDVNLEKLRKAAERAGERQRKKADEMILEKSA
jgi:hypothetical protein